MLGPFYFRDSAVFYISLDGLLSVDGHFNKTSGRSKAKPLIYKSLRHYLSILLIMAESMSTSDLAELTKDFTKQLSDKLTSGGHLVKLLNSHLVQTLPPTFKVDPNLLALHVQLLTYEYAIQIASEFPVKLIKSICDPQTKISAKRTTTGAASSANSYANGDRTQRISEEPATKNNNQLGSPPGSSMGSFDPVARTTSVAGPGSSTDSRNPTFDRTTTGVTGSANGYDRMQRISDEATTKNNNQLSSPPGSSIGSFDPGTPTSSTVGLPLGAQTPPQTMKSSESRSSTSNRHSSRKEKSLF
jgi:hypothetical protein